VKNNSQLTRAGIFAIIYKENNIYPLLGTISIESEENVKASNQINRAGGGAGRGAEKIDTKKDTPLSIVEDSLLTFLF